MRRSILTLQSFLCACVLICTSSLCYALLPNVLTQLSKEPNRPPSFAPVINKVMMSVVNIGTRNTRQQAGSFNQRNSWRSRRLSAPTITLGSGVVIDADKGYIVTNHHVTQKATHPMVTLADGRSFKAKFIGSDPDTDIAVLQIKADKLTAMPFANSADVRVGDLVLAIGNPFGLSRSVTSGIVSAVGRSELGIKDYENFIQTDASINPGNSGGALINLNSKMIGINTVILAPSGGNIGIGFAIPSNMVQNIVTQIVKYGDVKRGRLGISIMNVTEDLVKKYKLPNNQGAMVMQVVPKSSADKAGLQAGDVIIGVNQQPTRDAGQVRSAIGLQRIGSTLNLTILRQGKTQTLQAELKTLPFENGQISKIYPALAGATFSDDDPKALGVQVSKLLKGSPAWRAGLRVGDVIVGVNMQKLNNLAEFKKLVHYFSGGQLLLHVYRGNQAFYLIF